MQVGIGVCEWAEDHDFYHMLLDVGLGRAFICTLPCRLTNVAADKHFSDATSSHWL